MSWFVSKVNAEEAQISKRNIPSSVPLVFKILGPGGPFRLLGLATDVFLRGVGGGLNGIGQIVSDFFGALGVFLGIIIFNIGAFIQNILSGGKSKLYHIKLLLKGLF